MTQLKENTFFGEQDRYRLIKPLGQGGFSEVWLADDTKADLTVAIKVYAPGRGLDEDGVNLFRMEFARMFNLNHTNLLRPTHYDVFEKMPYLIMPYCKYGSCSKQSGKIDEDTAWKVLHDVASGLAYLHAQNRPVIHQDIKPDNILMSNSCSFLITDFGISSNARNTLRLSFHQPGTGAGTMAYMAPERFSKENMPIMAGDIWSLGASLFELMTGQLPFGQHGGLFLKGGAEIPAISGVWSSKLKKTVYGCMHEKPWKRPKAHEIEKLAKRHVKKEMEHETVTTRWKSATLLTIMFLILCIGVFIGHFLIQPKPQTNPMLLECIALIELGDSLYDENDKKTWTKTEEKYQKAKDLIDKHSLPLPSLERRIRQIRKKKEDAIHTGIETAKEFFSEKPLTQGSIRRGLGTLEIEVFVIDSLHREARELYNQYKKMTN